MSENLVEAMMNALKLAWGVCAIGATLMVVNARAETINCMPINAVPATINTPGIYCLTSSLNYSQATNAAIEINADDVVLDLNGHTLQGTGATQAYGVRSTNHSNITVRNGMVRGFQSGVVLYRREANKGQTCLIEDLSVVDSSSTGIYVMHQGCVVRRNRVMRTNPPSPVTAVSVTVGINVTGWGARVLDNSVYDTGTTLNPPLGRAYGILLSGEGTVVEGNRIVNKMFHGATDYGIYVAGRGRNVQLVANRIIGLSNGIFFQTGGSGEYRENLTTTVATPFTGGTSSGVNN